MQAPASVHTSTDMRTCSACRVRVHRDEVHKNRYGQYICKLCRNDGVRAVGLRRFQHLLQRMPTALLAFLGVVLAMAVATLVVLAVVKAHSYSNAGMVEDLKSLVRSINRLAH